MSIKRTSRGKISVGIRLKKRFRAELSSWHAMRQRCTNNNLKCFKDYGGRGIKVCDRWKSFENFIADMGAKPTPFHSIDRINNNGDYCPENCRWATKSEQSRNSRKCHYLVYRGTKDTVSGWAQRLGLERKTLCWRVNRMGKRLPEIIAGMKVNTRQC